MTPEAARQAAERHKAASDAALDEAEALEPALRELAAWSHVVRRLDLAQETREALFGVAETEYAAAEAYRKLAAELEAEPG